MRLAITGGGTGGHIYPAIAVGQEMKKLLPTTEVLYLGTAGSMEENLAEKNGLAFSAVRSSGVAGKTPWVKVKGLGAASLGVFDAVSHLRRFKPHVVFGTGGYASGPTLAAAWILGLPAAIQEQNAVPGRTNKIAASFCRNVFAAFEPSAAHFGKSRGKVIVTGNPVRPELLGKDKDESKSLMGLSPEKPAILLLGGSRGARTLIEAGMDLAAKDLGGWSLLMVTGERYYADVVSFLGAQSVLGIDGARRGNVIIRPYVHNMAAAYGAADLVICRAGGMTLSEITAVGLPAVIVPSPNVSNNHQEQNAKVVAEAGGAILIKEEGENTAKKIADRAMSLLSDKERLADMKKASSTMGKPLAVKDICERLMELAVITGGNGEKEK